MSERKNTLALRREALVERCRLQREQLAARQLEIRQSLSSFGGIAVIAAHTRKNALPLAGLLLGLIIMRPKRLLSLALSVTTAWKAWQKLSPLFAAILKRRTK